MYLRKMIEWIKIESVRMFKQYLRSDWYKFFTIGTLVIICSVFVYYYHFILGYDNVYTHLFYVPIVLSVLWWGGKGLYVAVGLTLLLISSNIFSGRMIFDNYIRGAIFIMISLVVYFLSERIKRAREREYHLNSVLHAIHNVNQLISTEKDRQQLIQGVCDDLTRNRGYINVWIALFDGFGKFDVAAQSGIGEDFKLIVDKMKDGDLTKCSGKALPESDVIIIEYPISQCANCPLSGRYAGRGAMTVRIKHRDRLYGIMTVSIPLDFIHSSDEHDLLKDVAGDIALALYSIEEEERRKSAEDALREGYERFRGIIENAPIGYFQISKDGLWQYVNWEWQAIHGYSHNEVIGKNFEIVYPEEVKEEVRGNVLRALSGEVISGKTIQLCKEGNITHHLISLQPIYQRGGIEAIEGFVNDITERIQAVNMIKESLKEKDLLLREIHHRVKNNMQVVSSILNLHSVYTCEDHKKDIFRDAHDRIYAMALIHEMLYQSPNMVNVDFSEYIKDFTAQLFHSHNIDSGRIRLVMDIQNVHLGIDQAIPCAQIINEIFSNSLKHAFPEKREGEIKIDFRRLENNNYSLMISDNGVGIPDGLDINKTDTLGLKLLNALVKQLKGNIEIVKNNGTLFVITF
ncbi:MAG: histidine kinase dimerization/phosphoacceptor domain -containing protein [Spirochaetota bacterium]|nr:histidine kinase dimerization/phosphoacceptor domain -containing protein [Spirochaetota bacterium]